MSNSADIAAIQKHINNELTPSSMSDKRIAGIIGDAPSTYSKSPALWNAAFRHLGVSALYLPFDVNKNQLQGLIATLRHCDSVLGFNVTVPYKVAVMDLLDDLDPNAQRIQAVNTVARTPDGKLIGYNTDGEGFVESILTIQPGRRKSFIRSLKGLDVLLLGAGGSARAVAFHVSDLLAGGQLLIANRTIEQGQALAQEIVRAGRQARAIGEEETAAWASRVSMIINSTTKGQGGMRKLSDGRVTNLEPYSALAPAHPPAFSESEVSSPAFSERWLESAQADIAANHQASMVLAKSVPQDVVFYDLIYHPEETVFLQHGRLTGHRTVNGKALIVCQAVIALCRRLCKQELHARNMDNEATEKHVAEVMYASW